jgi:hypothetical protein
MKAKITFYIGVVVTLINSVQIIISYDPFRFIGIAVGLFFIFWGWKVGWTQYKNVTMIVGHIAITIGSLVTAYALYQIPFLPAAPSFVEVLDLPLFWGIFTIWGGNCMITHGFCSCAIKMHNKNNNINC